MATELHKVTTPQARQHNIGGLLGRTIRMRHIKTIPVDVTQASSRGNRYTMRAYHTVLLRHVTWPVFGLPDFTGSYSGYTPGNLSDIVVIEDIESSRSVLPDILTVAMNEEVDGTAVTPLVVSQFSFNPLDYPDASAFYFGGVLSATASTTASLTLFNLSQQEVIFGTPLNTIITTPEKVMTSALAVGVGSGILKNVETLYEVRIENSGALISDITYLGHAFILIT